MAQRGRKPEDFQFSYQKENSKGISKKQRTIWSGHQFLIIALGTISITSLGAFLIFSELNNRVSESDIMIRKLEIQTRELLSERARLNALLKDQLSEQSATNAEQLKEYERNIQTLRQQITELSSELRTAISRIPNSSEIREIDGQIGESRSDIARLSNAVFFVSVFYYNLPRSTLIDIKNNLFAQMGFKAKTIEESWWTESPVVFYYDSFSKSKAEEVAMKIESIIDLPVKASLGSGKGISESERKTAIIVHINLSSLRSLTTKPARE